MADFFEIGERPVPFLPLPVLRMDDLIEFVDFFIDYCMDEATLLSALLDLSRPIDL